MWFSNKVFWQYLLLTVLWQYLLLTQCSDNACFWQCSDNTCFWVWHSALTIPASYSTCVWVWHRVLWQYLLLTVHTSESDAEYSDNTCWHSALTVPASESDTEYSDSAFPGSCLCEPCNPFPGSCLPSVIRRTACWIRDGSQQSINSDCSPLCCRSSKSG